MTGMITDPRRLRRADAGRAEICNVCQLHRFFGRDYETIWEGEWTARTGCVDTKELLAERISDFLHAMRVKRRKLADAPALVGSGVSR